jgi:hypothetical protein
MRVEGAWFGPRASTLTTRRTTCRGTGRPSRLPDTSPHRLHSNLFPPPPSPFSFPPAEPLRSGKARAVPTYGPARGCPILDGNRSLA